MDSLNVVEDAIQIAVRLEARYPWEFCAKLFTHRTWLDLVKVLQKASPEAYAALRHDVFREELPTPQPKFRLLAQDITADLIVDFWTLIQMRVWADLKAGLPLREAVSRAREHFGVPEYPPCLHHPKLDGAAEIACDMRAWPSRKLAD
jgi:hypothetical protein